MSTSAIQARWALARHCKLNPYLAASPSEYLKSLNHRQRSATERTSYDEQHRMTLKALNDCGELIECFVRRYGLGISHGGADGQCPLVTGDPICIYVDWIVDDLELVVARMFDGTKPFHLWGVPQKVTEQHYRARAVDLQVGGTLIVDIRPKSVCIQLPKVACENTVVRFIESLQNHADSEVGAALRN